MAQQQQAGKQEQALRSVFVGNIPYDATEEKLREIFSTVGPVIGFRLVYDRDTGKPKGYGFCEYKDQETAASAIRNLNGHDFCGRQLRVDSASNERAHAEEFKSSLQSNAGVTNIGLNNAGAQPFYQDQQAASFRGPEMEPDKAPEMINKTMASLPPEQMFELAKQMKQTIQTNPNEARNMLIQNPQLCYALLQALVSMRAVDPNMAMNILHRPMGQQIPVAAFAQAGTIMNPQPMGPAMMGNVMGGMQPVMSQQMRPGPQSMPMQMPMQPGVGAQQVISSQNLGPAFVQSTPFGDPNIGSTGGPIGPQNMPVVTNTPMTVNAPLIPAPVSQAQQPQPNPRDPRLNRARPMGPSTTPAAPVPAPSAQPQNSMSEQEKQSLIMKVLQLSDHDISLLPPEQQQKVMMLREQVAAGRAGGQ